jgi:hypothetical protein
VTHGPLAPLIATPQWIVVLLVPLANGKTDKLPMDPRTWRVTAKDSGGAHNPAMWMGHATASAAVARLGAGHCLGFVITAADPFWCLDIDNALQPGNTWSPLALALRNALPGTVIEVSQSGRGLHIWGQGAVPSHASKNIPLGLELYTELRFIALGSHQTGDMTQPCAAIAQVAATYFPPRETAGVDLPDDGPRADWRGPTDDDDLLRRALQSRSAAAAFGTGASFADLWEGNDSALARAYPPDSSSSEPFDRSSADAALFQHLAFWTGCDQARMLRIAQRSALKRDKWEREDYVARTVTRACTLQHDVLQDRPDPTPPMLAPAAAPSPVAPPAPPADAAPTHPTAPTAAMTARDGSRLLGAQQQQSLFAGCVYVADYHQVLCPGGVARDPARFKTIYGGYSFVMDNQNTRVVRDAFEAFTQSQIVACPVVDGTAFKPSLPYGTVIESEGRKRVNTYWPANVARKQGDATPFLRHLEKLLPDAGDRRILLYYLAGCVQFVGHKFQWFPLLVGVEGNGKSFLSECAANAVGQRYTHWPAADKLGKDFNAWLFGRVLFCIEDLKIGDSAEVWEKLKPMITGRNLEIEGKGIDQRTDEICGNFIANSNHRDAIRATIGDRRVCHLWTAQMTVADLARDGMNDAYHAALYDWGRAGGFAIVSEFLHTMVIPPEFGLNWLLGRAPKSSSTHMAIEASRGRIEQEILEQVEQDAVGFRGGWISSIYLDRFLTGAGRGSLIPLNRRRDLLQSIGYDWHPALAGGRVDSLVLPDAGKPRLYLKAGHAAATLSRAEAAREYTRAQGVGS